MPYMRGGKRDYKRENRLYNSRPEEVRKRVLRNAARRAMERMGLVHKGDDKDVDHINPLSKGGGNARSNLRVRGLHSNRSFKRTASSAIKKTL